MRLLFVHDRFGAMAGAEVNLQLTAAELKRRGHSIGILHGPASTQAENAWNDLFESRFPVEFPADLPGVLSAIKAFQPDAIYVHKMTDLKVLQALADAGIPVARMVHDHDLYCLRSYKYFPGSRRICTHAAGLRCLVPCGAFLVRDRKNGFPFRLQSLAAKKKELALNRRFQRMIVATDFMRQELLRNDFDFRRIEIHAPVPRSIHAPQSCFSERNRIIFAGQVIRGKGVDVLLRALATIETPFECVIVGDGHHRSFCEQLSRKLHLEDRVHFKGYVPPAELEQFYTDASVAVVSSVWPEPFGAVGLEAMRFGLPVVAFDAGGIREWLIDGHNGFLVPWMNHQRFGQRVEQLLRNKALGRALGENGRRLVEERFGFEQYIDGLERMFAGLIGEVQTHAVQ